MNSTSQGCTSCGAPIQDGQNVCPSCGATGSQGYSPQSGYAPGAAPGSYGVYPGHAAQAYPIASHPAPENSKKGKKGLLWGILGLGVVLVAGVAFMFFRGGSAPTTGAPTPEAAIDRLVDAVESNDLVGLASIISPAEREPVMRVLGTAASKYNEAVASGEIDLGTDENNAELSADGLLQGLEIRVNGVNPRITELSADLVVADLSRAHMSVGFNARDTRGLLRQFVELADAEDERFRERVSLDEAFWHGEFPIMLTKYDGGWYVSPYLTVIDMANLDEGTGERGRISALGREAKSAEAAVDGFIAAHNRESYTDLVAHLSKTEAQALQLYWDGYFAYGFGLDAEFRDVRTAPLRSFGNSSQLQITEATVIDYWGDEMHYADGCMEYVDLAYDAECLPTDLFHDNSSILMFVMTSPGTYTLTAVEEDGVWGVSLLDTVANNLVAWIEATSVEEFLEAFDLQGR